jgi:hypothetical protein
MTPKPQPTTLTARRLKPPSRTSRKESLERLWGWGGGAARGERQPGRSLHLRQTPPAPASEVVSSRRCDGDAEMVRCAETALERYSIAYLLLGELQAKSAAQSSGICCAGADSSRVTSVTTPSHSTSSVAPAGPCPMQCNRARVPHSATAPVGVDTADLDEAGACLLQHGYWRYRCCIVHLRQSFVRARRVQPRTDLGRRPVGAG